MIASPGLLALAAAMLSHAFRSAGTPARPLRGASFTDKKWSHHGSRPPRYACRSCDYLSPCCSLLPSGPDARAIRTRLRGHRPGRTRHRRVPHTLEKDRKQAQDARPAGAPSLCLPLPPFTRSPAAHNLSRRSWSMPRPKRAGKATALADRERTEAAHGGLHPTEHGHGRL